MSRMPRLGTGDLQRLLAPARPRLDFQQSRRRQSPLAIALLCAGLLACMALAVRVQWLDQDLRRLGSGATVGTTHVSGVANTPSLPKALALQAEQASAVIARLSMPWDSWFRQLETAAKGKVVLTALQPETDGRRVRISGEARRFDDLVDYAMQLEATPGFANVFLSEHTETGNGVNFTLNADWVGGR